MTQYGVQLVQESTLEVDCDPRQNREFKATIAVTMTRASKICTFKNT